MKVGDILRLMRARPDVGWSPRHLGARAALRGPTCAALACAAWWLVACADAPDPDRPPPATNAGRGGATAGSAAGLDAGMGRVPADTVVVLPDTQFYACAYPEIFAQQTRWISEQRAAFGIALVLHTGDIVDSDVKAQWDVASTALHALDGEVPYLMVPGNHDLRADRSSLMPEYFAADLLDLYDWDAQSREPDRLDNAYAIVEVAGRRWLFIGLEFAPRDAAVDWAAQVLREHAELPAVLFTHAYLDGDGRRYDRSFAPHQKYHPDDYGMTPEQGVNDGQDLWNKLIEPHENVRLTLSGHAIPDGTAHVAAERSTGTRVHQLLANYQQCDLCPCAQVEGGGGYLRMLRFAEDGKSIGVTTYSPHFDRSLRDEENEFVLDLP
jgi:hypothetical protein